MKKETGPAHARKSHGEDKAGTREEQDAPREKPESATHITEENIDYLEQLKIVQADFENYKKRVAREREMLCKYASESLISKLLEVLDNIERALETDSDYGSLRGGLELIHGQFRGILESEGLKEIKGKGEKFNPELHEALFTEESSEEEDTILEEIQKGYSLNGRLIRPSKVKVSKKKTDEKKTKGENQGR